MKQFWMVWNEGNRAPAIKHETEKSAKEEAERLARLDPGGKFHVLTALRYCTGTVGIRWNKQWAEFAVIVPVKKKRRTNA